MATNCSTNAGRRDSRDAEHAVWAWSGSLAVGMRDASGQMYMRNRYYDPQTGQFTQMDSIGLAGGLNAYGFADGDPITYDDPYGLSAEDCCRNDASPQQIRQEIAAARAGAAIARSGRAGRVTRTADRVLEGTAESATRSNRAGRTAPSTWRMGPNDLDWRGSGRGVRQAVDEAFSRTGVSRDQFVETRWGRDANGKSFPVEWRAPGGAEVNIDLGHLNNGPTVPHVGYQTPGRRGTGGGVRGHILVDEVPYNR